MAVCQPAAAIRTVPLALVFLGACKVLKSHEPSHEYCYFSWHIVDFGTLYPSNIVDGGQVSVLSDRASSFLDGDVFTVQLQDHLCYCYFTLQMSIYDFLTVEPCSA